MDRDSEKHEMDAGDERPAVDLYDPFDRSFSSRKREDPLLRLYDKKKISDDF